MVTGNADDGAPTNEPMTSFAVMLWPADDSGLLVMLHAPVILSEVVVPTRFPSAKSLMVVFRSAVPVKVGAVTLVMLSVLVPFGPKVSSAVNKSGVDGRVSTVTGTSLEVCASPPTVCRTEYT
jgi:hypothetical protein